MFNPNTNFGDIIAYFVSQKFKGHMTLTILTRGRLSSQDY